MEMCSREEPKKEHKILTETSGGGRARPARAAAWAPCHRNTLLHGINNIYSLIPITPYTLVDPILHRPPSPPGESAVFAERRRRPAASAASSPLPYAVSCEDGYGGACPIPTSKIAAFAVFLHEQFIFQEVAPLPVFLHKRLIC
uniref:Uncharacterized protein n=1 Tax=Oryza meridionalis TaxID=40149 RepID=A0A0E0F6W8_9ORYZ